MRFLIILVFTGHSPKMSLLLLFFIIFQASYCTKEKNIDQIETEYYKIEEDIGRINTKTGLKLREKPDTNSQTLTVISFEEFVKPIKKSSKKYVINQIENSWYYVDYNGIKGYIFGAYLDLAKYFITNYQEVFDVIDKKFTYSGFYCSGETRSEFDLNFIFQKSEVTYEENYTGSARECKPIKENEPMGYSGSNHIIKKGHYRIENGIIKIEFTKKILEDYLMANCQGGSTLITESELNEKVVLKPIYCIDANRKVMGFKASGSKYFDEKIYVVPKHTK